MKKVYLAISLKQKDNFREIICALSEMLQKYSLQLFVFVDEYHFHSAEAKKMMEQAKKDIESSDFIIAEVTDKAIGVGIEVGYASALKKKIIYIRKVNSEYSTTVGGIANYEIIYNSDTDLCSDIEKILPNLI